MKLTKSQLKQIIKEELNKIREGSRREEWYHKLWPDRKNSSVEDVGAEADAAREAGDHDKADALDDIANDLEIQKDRRGPHW